MICSKYALIILNELFQTKANAGTSYDDELQRLKDTYGLTQLSNIPGYPDGWAADKWFDAFKADHYMEGENYRALEQKATEIKNSRWFTFTKNALYSKPFQYTLDGVTKTVSYSPYTLARRSNGPVDHYPTDAYLALFTKMPDGSGFNYAEPTDTDYMRINLHWSLLTGGETLNKAAADQDNNNIATISNKEIIMYPEIPGGASWGTIVGFGVFENETDNPEEPKPPILWGRLENEGGVPTEGSHVPLFRKGNFKVTLS